MQLAEVYCIYTPMLSNSTASHREFDQRSSGVDLDILCALMKGQGESADWQAVVSSCLVIYMITVLGLTNSL